MVEIVDVTPTWEQILPMLLMAYEQGNPTGKAIAKEELTRMAQTADKAAKYKAAIDSGELVWI